GYYDTTKLPLYPYAAEYAFADNFFTAAFGGSWLNHMWLVCACTPPWPNAPEVLWKSVQHLTDSQIDKITHLNAMRVFNFPMFDYIPKEQLTVGALREKARAAGVDTTPISSGGQAPLAPGEKPRPVTSKDIIDMYTRHAQAAYEDA
ncbi:MAG: hypothetical protein N2423_10160, partial [Novosphingobium sp.]|nr:hypothetical protein [Novosphingobium sp.]